MVSDSAHYRIGYRIVEQIQPANISHAAIQFDARRHSESLVLGVHFGHDSTLAAVLGGQVLGVIELERLHRIRYFTMSVETSIFSTVALGFDPAWNADVVRKGKSKQDVDYAYDFCVARLVAPALEQLCKLVSQRTQARLISSKPCGMHYDLLVSTRGYEILIEALQRVVKATKVEFVDHHHAHAALGWFDSPFYRSSHNGKGDTFVLSYDNNGNDGALRTFLARSGNPVLRPLGDAMNFSFGRAYETATTFVRDFAWGTPYGSRPPGSIDGEWTRFASLGYSVMSLPGAFMSYAALGSQRETWRTGAKLFLMEGIWDSFLWPSPHEGSCTLEMHSSTHQYFVFRYFTCNGADENSSRRLDKDFAATIQSVFEEVVITEVRQRIALVKGPPPTSMVITGGCGLNVKANSALARSLDLPTHVPPAPGDNGLPVGAAWLVAPPSPEEKMSRIQFAGFPLHRALDALEAAGLRHLVSMLGGEEVENVEVIADYLNQGAIVGLARGRSEFGPRALGHRSFLSTAYSLKQKDRLNQLKNRRWYRPCSPIVAEEDLYHIFESGPDLVFGAPYMSFAPPLKAWVVEWFPAIAHLDNTARPQSVRATDDPWMHSLLAAIRSTSANRYPTRQSETYVNSTATNYPRAVGVLINTSLNNKGKPMVGDALDALELFCEPGGDDLDLLLLEEKYLFKGDIVRSRGLCLELAARDKPTTHHAT